TWTAHVLGPARAEDAIQEIFLRLWQHAGQFNRGRGTFVSWFTAVVRHPPIHELRRRAGRRRLGAAYEIAEVLATVPPGEPPPSRRQAPWWLVPCASFPRANVMSSSWRTLPA